MTWNDIVVDCSAVELWPEVRCSDVKPRSGVDWGVVVCSREKQKQKKEEKMDELWTLYRVRLDSLNELCASVPADPQIIKIWLESRQPRVKAPGARSMDEINEEVLATLGDEEREPSILVFQHNPTNGNNLVVREDTIRAHLKDCAHVLSGYTGKIKGVKSLYVNVKNCVYLNEKELFIPILRPDGSLITKADGQIEKPIHAIDGRTGRPINALKCFEFVAPWRIDFTIKVLMNAVSRKDLETVLMYGGTHGYAGERSAGKGKYTFTIQPEVKDAREETRSEAAKESGANLRGQRASV